MSDSDPVAVAIERIADIAEAFGHQAGVGGMETAGQVVSYLSAHPDWIGAFMKGGVFALPADWFEHGRLTWHAANGKVVHPQEARLARKVKGMRP